MIIAIGSTNQAKVQAVVEVIKDYPLLANAKVVAIATDSEVGDQPLSLQETIQGAKNRARKAFEMSKGCSYGLGIESGLMQTFEASGSYLHTCACAIYDGKNYSTGLSTGFEIPPPILDLVLKRKCNLSQACLESGITTNTKIGSAEGLVGILTQGRVDRKEYSKECVRMALVKIMHTNWYVTNAP